MTEQARTRRLKELRKQIAELERKRDRTPNGPERDDLNEQIDDLSGVYEDLL
jgi:septal ring factor EnvC (AmiA/AmiB activator)